MLALRLYNPRNKEETGFLYSNWLKSYKPSRDVGPVPNNLYWKLISETIAQILAIDGTKVVMAVAPDDTDQLFGFICSTGPVVHFVYVKPSLRRQGVGKALLTTAVERDQPFKYTFRTRDAKYLAKTVGTYDPRPVRSKPESPDA